MTDATRIAIVGLGNGHFAGLIAEGRSEVDASPLTLVADAFLRGRQAAVAAFVE